MTDVLSAFQRSYCMSRVRGNNTRIEIAVRHALHKNGFRYRICAKELPGKPDILLPRYQTVVFVHGCFWHGHSCPKGKLPTTNAVFWKTKITQNKQRDRRTERELRKAGWSVITIWECSASNGTNKLLNILFDKRRYIAISRSA